MTDKLNLHELATDLARASAYLLDLEMKESVARSATTSQRNEVNKLQKQFDAAVIEVRNAAGIDTDWGARRRSGQSMAAE